MGWNWPITGFCYDITSILDVREVGKTSIIDQFMSSEHADVYENNNDDQEDVEENDKDQERYEEFLCWIFQTY